ncbi:MAG: HigA family addiction module antidote protein [Spirochaetes bacterium]|nr:HigA family addiction module antidote protein [Spirochaetota bacterium]
MKRLPNIHPGEILEEEFLKPLNITAYRIAKETKISQTRISEIIKGKRGITADTALRFSKFFGTSPQFWLGLQNDFDLEEEIHLKSKVLDSIHNFNEINLSRV